jgi:hypothetical protein
MFELNFVKESPVHRMVSAVQDCLADRAALGSIQHAAFTMGGDETVYSLFLVERAHGPEMKM